MVARVIPKYIPQVAGDPTDWYPNYPNPADFQFDYYRLLALAKDAGTPIGYAPSGGASVAVIGAGAAGMTAARELYRAGYNVTVYEASDRICGRHYTDRPAPGAKTGMELGAMRFPFFSEPGSKNSVFDYYLNAEAPGITSPFPNPGTAPGNTGIYVNRGWGPNDQFYPNQEMIIWDYKDVPFNPPPNPALAEVYVLENRFVEFFSNVVAPVYGTADWPAMWQQIANQYDKMTFSDLVFAEAIDTYNNDGWLGGFGMNDAQSELFYVIGAGDGSWGAFYEIGALWFIRCVMFGFNSNLQTMSGIDGASNYPYYNDSTLTDSLGNVLPPPQYFGIQSLVQWLMYVPPPAMNDAFYDAIHNGSGQKLLINTPVTAITYNGNSVIVTANDENVQYDYVILTPQIWASQLGVAMNGFSPTDLPDETIAARNEQHMIASCKVFFPLRQAYWTNNISKIPQVIVTDTFVQDAYGVQWTSNDAGVLLASYTWEDDALKLLPYSNDAVASMVIKQLDAITSSTLGENVSDYITHVNDAVVFQWTTQVGYNGCAKLYRQRNWQMNYALLAYNQQNSQSSRLYLAGETFSVEGGWTEPALRLALDAVIRIIQNSGGTFANGFNVATDYPTYDTTFEPDETYNSNP
ncbi:MAG TPA: FAD-dependent oxidoreductase [Thermoanaerobaculia bacterium]|nr:FAD-dependent oxidoreductase [Thermoanaerobaculia bacterium]